MTGTTSGKQNRLNQAAFNGAALVTAGVTAAVTGEVLHQQLKPVAKTMWDSALLQRDTAINKMPILCAHNSGSEGGSGTMFFNQNQTLKPYDILENSPVRALEFQVEDYNGTLITNHGAALSDLMIDPTVSHPETLQSQMDSVKQWLSESQNCDQVIFIQVQNNAPNVDLNSYLQKTFGDQLADGNTWQNSSVNDLVHAGKHVVVLPISMNDIFRSGGYSYSDYWEDRTLLGNLGNEITATLPVDEQFVGQLNTDQVDALIKKGGLIKLDDLSPNDPRLIDPAFRNQLAFDPDVYLFDGLIHVNRGILSALTFGVGIFSAVGTAAFSIANSVAQAYKNYTFIQKADQHLKDTINNLDSNKLLVQMKKLEKAFATPKDILDFSQQQCLNKITQDTLTDGAMGTTSIAASIFSMGLLFPVIFPLTSVLTIVTVGLGILATVAATLLNRRTLQNNLEKFASNDAVTKLCETQARKTTITLKKTNYLKYQALAKNETEENNIATVNSTLLSTTILLRIGSLAKYTISFIGVLAAGALALAALSKTALDSLVHYRKRQQQLSDLSGLIALTTVPDINKKSGFLVGKTPLEKFINSERHKLPAKFASLSATKISRFANSEDREEHALYLKLRKNCIASLLQQDFQKFTKTHSGDTDTLIKQYLLNQIGKHIASDVKTAGRVNAFKIACSIGFSGSFLAPAFTAIFGIISIGIMLVSELTSRVVAYTEAKKFKLATAEFLDKSVADKELQRFINLIKSNNSSSSATIYQALGQSSASPQEVKTDAVTMRPALKSKAFLKLRGRQDTPALTSSVSVDEKRLAM
jgi:hypothetical protein